MKFYIDTEEWYPVYQIVDDYDHVDDDLKTVIPPRQTGLDREDFLTVR